MSTQPEYELHVKIRDKNIQFRKWKVKDRKKFLSSLDSVRDIKDSLVYDCLKDKTLALSEEEYGYMLIKIRAASLGTQFTYDLNCSACNTNHQYTVDVNNIRRPVFGKYSEISVNGHNFKIQGIRNKIFYDEAMVSSKNKKESYLIDFILHIGSYNDNDGVTFDDVNGIIDNMDIDVFEEIINEWDKMKFNIDSEHSVTCPACTNTQLYDFDILPGFFPDSWEL